MTYVMIYNFCACLKFELIGIEFDLQNKRVDLTLNIFSIRQF